MRCRTKVCGNLYMSDNEELIRLQKEREKFITRIFWFGFEIALIFGVPAAIGAFLGVKLGGDKMLIATLVPAFVLSWVIVIIRYRQIAKKMNYLDSRIKELKELKDNSNQEDAKNDQ